jgi:hypothetical protein
MDASVISALAALMGAAIGGLASFFASWVTQRMQLRAQWIVQERLRRQDLHKEFIEEATKCYLDALQHDKGDIPALITLYTKISRMRMLSSQKVVENAEGIGHKILDTYLKPDKTFLELRDMVRPPTLSTSSVTSRRPAVKNLIRFRANSSENHRKARRVRTCPSPRSTPLLDVHLTEPCDRAMH